MAESMIERVAEFLKIRDENVMPHEVDDEERRASAVAILEHLLEPTDRMVASGSWARNDGGEVGSTGAKNAYVKMITAALEETQ